MDREYELSPEILAVIELLARDIIRWREAREEAKKILEMIPQEIKEADEPAGQIQMRLFRGR